MKKIRSQKSQVRNQKRTLNFYILHSAFCILFLLSGCRGGNQTSDSAMVRRAQIIADENIQLKKTDEKKDEQISGLSAELQQIISLPGAGTKVSIEVPLEAEAPHG